MLAQTPNITLNIDKILLKLCANDDIGNTQHDTVGFLTIFFHLGRENESGRTTQSKRMKLYCSVMNRLSFSFSQNGKKKLRFHFGKWEIRTF